MKYLKNFSSQGEYDMYRAVLPFPTLCSVPNGASVGAEFAQLAPMPNDEIWYTSADGSAVSPGTASFGSGITVVSNTYADGKGVIKLSGNATEIGSYAFSYHGSLTSIIIPDSVTSIGDSAFGSCTALASIAIPDSVTTIGDYVFQGCAALTSIVVGASNQTYDSRDNCNAIIETSSNKLVIGCKSTVIPSSVTWIGDSAFGSCTGLASIAIPDSVTWIGDYAFNGCTSLASIAIPDSVTSIGYSAFQGCTGLASITIPDSVITITNNMFYHCTGLTSITIPDSVSSIGSNAFAGCTSLASIVIPDSVTSIGGYAFNGCMGLASVTCQATTPPTLGNTVFDNTNGCPIYVPSASVDAYKAASKWSSYAGRIQAIPS